MEISGNIKNIRSQLSLSKERLAIELGTVPIGMVCGFSSIFC